jgi:hypothetical protein
VVPELSVKILSSNSFNRASDNLAVEESFDFYQKNSSYIKQANHNGMFKKASKSVCTSTTVVSPDHLYPTPSNLSTSSVVNTPENTEADPDSPKPANEEDTEMEYTIKDIIFNILIMSHSLSLLLNSLLNPIPVNIQINQQ